MSSVVESGPRAWGAGAPWEWVKHEAPVLELLYVEREGPELRRLSPKQEAVDVAGVRGCDGTLESTPPPPTVLHTAVFGIRLWAPTLGPPWSPNPPLFHSLSA